MKIVSNIRPTSPPLATDAQVQASCRLTTTDEQALWTDLLDACTAYAEEAMDTSLLTRTITAVFYRSQGYEYPYAWQHNDRNRLFLPRGPVQSVTSVKDAAGKDISYTQEGYGLADVIRPSISYTAPLTVVYQAGYGSNMTDVPADIRMAIRTHVAHLMERREAADERQITDVPHSLSDFYAARRRSPMIG